MFEWGHVWQSIPNWDKMLAAFRRQGAWGCSSAWYIDRKDSGKGQWSSHCAGGEVVNISDAPLSDQIWLYWSYVYNEVTVQVHFLEIFLLTIMFGIDMYSCHSVCALSYHIINLPLRILKPQILKKLKKNCECSSISATYNKLTQLLTYSFQYDCLAKMLNKFPVPYCGPHFFIHSVCQSIIYSSSSSPSSLATTSLFSIYGSLNHNCIMICSFWSTWVFSHENGLCLDLHFQIIYLTQVHSSTLQIARDFIF